MYNKRCCKRLQTAACNEYTEKYSRGRRGAPAKGVGRLSRRESSNLSFSANAKAPKRVPFLRWRRRRDSLLCRSLRSKWGADNQAASRGSSLTNAGGADCSRGGSSQTSIVRSTKNALHSCTARSRVQILSRFSATFKKTINNKKLAKFAI